MSESRHDRRSRYDEVPRSPSPTGKHGGIRVRSRSRGSRRHDKGSLDERKSKNRSDRSFELSTEHAKPGRHSSELNLPRDKAGRDRGTEHRYRSRSRSPKHRRRQYSRSRSRDRYQSERRDRGDRRVSQSPRPKRSAAPLPSQKAAFSRESQLESAESKSGNQIDKPLDKEKEKPNYKTSGLLAAETNKVANTDVVLKYNEPPESRLPPASQPWRLYVFKSKDLLDTIPLHTRPCWLFGREKAVVDVPVEHPSCSKQHAVLQFRYLDKVVGEFGERKSGVGLYIIDLESANGTKLNGEAVPKRRFVECRNGDVINFGDSSREYVVLLPPKD